jgi:hypothetical protein
MAHPSLYLVAWQVYPGPNKIEAVPQNATELITDWEANVRPEYLIESFAPELLSANDREAINDWYITDRTVEVDTIDRRLLLSLASNPEIAAAFEASPGYVWNPRIAGFDFEEKRDRADWELPVYARSRIRGSVQPNPEVGDRFSVRRRSRSCSA